MRRPQLVDTRHRERIGALHAAALLVGFGSRPATVRAVTGLSPSEIRDMRSHCKPLVGGGQRESFKFLLRRSVLLSLQSSWAVCCFDSLVKKGGMCYRDALVHAYAAYLQRFQCPNAAARQHRGAPPQQAILSSEPLTIDQLYGLVRITFGLWGAARTLSIVHCSRCHARFVCEPIDSGATSQECPFCKAASRYRLDSRVRQFLDTASRVSALPPDVDILLTKLDRAAAAATATHEPPPERPPTPRDTRLE